MKAALLFLIFFFLFTSLLHHDNNFFSVRFSPVVSASFWDRPFWKRFTTTSNSHNEVPSNSMTIPIRSTFRCQRPLSSFGRFQMLAGDSLERVSQTSGSDARSSSSAPLSTCDFTYFKVLNTKVEVSNCECRKKDVAHKNLEETITVVDLPQRKASVSTMDDGANDVEKEGRTHEENRKTPRHPAMANTDRTSLADVPTANDDSCCTATVFLDFEASPQLQLLLAHQYTNNSYGPLKEGKSEKEGRMVEEALDVWRYSLTLFHVTEKGEIQYKGYDQNGYSMCCDLLRSSSPTSEYSFCSWHSSSLTNTDEDEQGDGPKEVELKQKEEDENEDGYAPPPQTRFVHMDRCPLPQIPSNTSSSHATDTTSLSFTGRISKPLPALIAGEWLAKIQLWRTRYGAWERKRRADAAQEEGEGREETPKANTFRDPPSTHESAKDRNAASKRHEHNRGERKPFMEDEENVELLGRVVISFHVDENITNKKKAKISNRRDVEDHHKALVQDDEFPTNDKKKTGNADTPHREGGEEEMHTSFAKMEEMEAEPPRETDL